jgi:hypothetical protein
MSERWNLVHGSAAAAVVAVVLLSPAAANAQVSKCTGTKQWYAGKCRYPDDIAKMKTEEEAQRRAAEQRRAEEQRRKAEAEAERKAEEEAGKRAEAEEADAAACKRARRDDTVDSWQSYLDNFPNGKCREEATDRIDALKHKPEPPPEPEPEQPKAEPPPRPKRLPPAPKPPPRVEPAPPSPMPPEERRVSPVAWPGFAVGGAGFLIGGITGGVAASKASALRAACPDKVCDPGKQSDLDSAKRLADVSTAMFVVGGIGAGVGLVALIVSLSGDDKPSDAKTGFVVRPMLGAGSLGLRGEF